MSTTHLKSMVKTIKSTKCLQQKELAEEARRLNESSRDEIGMLREAIQSMLMREMKGIKDYVVQPHVADQWGSILTVSRIYHFGRGTKPETNYVGTLCVAYESRSCRYSDDTPEVESSCISVFFARIVNGNNPYFKFDVNNEHPFYKCVKPTVDTVRRLMADWLAGQR